MNKLIVNSSLGGRILIALIFVLAGLNKIGAIEGTQGYMEAMGVPGILVYPTILFGGFLFLARDGTGQPSLDNRRISTTAVAS